MMLAVLVAMVVRVTTSVSIISVVTPHREDRDELPPLSTALAIWSLLASQHSLTAAATFLVCAKVFILN